MANDTKIRLGYTPSLPSSGGGSLYVQIEAPDLTIWNGTSWAVNLLASWATFATAMPETPAGTGNYVAQFPTSAPAGNYIWRIYKQAGASPAASDGNPTPLATGRGYWDGTTFGGAASVTNQVQVDFSQAIPVRAQDSVTTPTHGDALLGAWVEPFAKETTDATALTYTKKLPDGSTAGRSYTLVTDANGNVTARN